MGVNPQMFECLGRLFGGELPAVLLVTIVYAGNDLRVFFWQRDLGARSRLERLIFCLDPMSGEST